MTNYYNDNDPKVCAWLRELIAAGELSPGDVDERSITEIKADELAKYDQCHFFAGIGGWPLALRWAGLENATGIWTGSCPCQPFSCAGAGKGTADERHLWPAFRELILACRPTVVFGEQVASAAVVGKVGRGIEAPAVPVWLDGVRADMEAAGYAFGASVLGAHSVGAPHIRQRLYWAANAGLLGSSRTGKQTAGSEKHCGIGGLANADGEQDNSTDEGRLHAKSCCKSGAFRLANADGNGLQPGERDNPPAGYGDTPAAAGGDDRQKQPCQNNSFWGAVDWLFCRDGKWRPVEPGTFPLADGVPGKMGLLRGYGNAIVPQVAAEFVMAWAETQNTQS